jgi:hypothetical protein
MATTETEPTRPPIVELSPEEAWADFDNACRRRLGMSGEEFIRRLDAGDFDEIVDDPINHPGYSHLAMLSDIVR